MKDSPPSDLDTAQICGSSTIIPKMLEQPVSQPDRLHRGVG